MIRNDPSGFLRLFVSSPVARRTSVSIINVYEYCGRVMIENMIIAIEGIDGAGKTTLLTTLREQLHAEVIAFPRYETSIHAQLVRRALYQQMGDLTDSAYAMATLFALDRHEARELLHPFVASNALVILDRYVASNAAYSWARTGDEAIVDWVAELEFNTLGVPRPDLQVFLNTTPDIAGQRAIDREQSDSSRARDSYESDRTLQQRTADAYGQLVAQNWQSPWLIVEPEADYLHVADRITAALQ